MKLRTLVRAAAAPAILALVVFAVDPSQAQGQGATPAVPGGAGAASTPTPAVPGLPGGASDVPGGGTAANPPATSPLPNTVGGPVQVTPLPEGMLGVENMSLSQLAGIHLASLSYGQWEYLKKALVAKAEQLLRENAPYVEYVPVDLIPYLEAEGKMSQEEKKKLRDTDRAYSRASEFKEYVNGFGPKNPFSGKGGLDALGFMLSHDLPPNPSGGGSKTNATPAPSQPPKGGVAQDTPSWSAPTEKQTENTPDSKGSGAPANPETPPPDEIMMKTDSNPGYSVPGPSVSNASYTESSASSSAATSSQGGTPFSVSATITEASGTYTVNQSGVLTAKANGSATNSNIVTTVTSGAASPPGAAGASAKPMLATPNPVKTAPKSGTPASTNPAEKSVVAPTAEPPAASGVPGG